MSKFVWEAGEITLEEPVETGEEVTAALAAEIAKIDRILKEAAVADIGDAVTAEDEPLYVSRRVSNATAILRWAAAAGIENLEKASELHVTITYSRAPVDWMAMGAPWDEGLNLPAGGPRRLAIFGDGSLVLEFTAYSLNSRHEEMLQAGASWDWEGYRPHITLAKGYAEVPAGIGAPYQGPIVLGPELFERIKDEPDLQ